MNKQTILLGISTCLLYGALQADARQDLPKLEQEIKERQKELDQRLLLEGNKTTQSQGDFILDWPEYSREVEEIKKLQDQADELEKEIEILEQRKSRLLQPRSTTEENMHDSEK